MRGVRTVKGLSGVKDHLIILKLFFFAKND
jgi:hypothetical protein